MSSLQMPSEINEITEEASYNKAEFNALLSKVYAWTFLGLLITTVTAFCIQKFFTDVLETLYHKPETILGIAVFELALVWALKAFVNRLPSFVSYAALLIYAVLNGFIFTAIFYFFGLNHVPETFGVITIMFAFAAISGIIFKANLANLGGFFMLLIPGAISIIAVNIIQKSESIYWIINCAAFLIFLVTALNHRNKIMMWCNGTRSYTLDGSKPSILGALMLYLDFLLLFILVERYIEL